MTEWERLLENAEPLGEDNPILLKVHELNSALEDKVSASLLACIEELNSASLDPKRYVALIRQKESFIFEAEAFFKKSEHLLALPLGVSVETVKKVNSIYKENGGEIAVAVAQMLHDYYFPPEEEETEELELLEVDEGLLEEEDSEEETLPPLAVYTNGEALS